MGGLGGRAFIGGRLHGHRAMNRSSLDGAIVIKEPSRCSLSRIVAFFQALSKPFHNQFSGTSAISRFHPPALPAVQTARKVYQTCFATVPLSTPAEAATLAPLVLGAVALELPSPPPPASGASASAAVARDSLPAQRWKSLVDASDPPPLASVLAAEEELTLRALCFLAWLGSAGGVGIPGSSGGAPPQLGPEDLVWARRGYQDLLSRLVETEQWRAEHGLGHGHGHGAWGGPSGVAGGGGWGARLSVVGSAAAFELLAGRMRGAVGAGVKAALALYDQVLAALGGSGEPQRAQHAGVERLWVWRCQLAADAAARLPLVVSPAASRVALRRALRCLPANPRLLGLLVAQEVVGHTIMQLRRDLQVGRDAGVGAGVDGGGGGGVSRGIVCVVASSVRLHPCAPGPLTIVRKRT
jgi:hypothetical protein